MLREDAQVERVLLSHNMAYMFYLRRDKIRVRMMNDIHTPLYEIQEEGL